MPESKVHEHWVCQICGKPIPGATGILRIFNINPLLGPVGSYPKERSLASPEFEHPEEVRELWKEKGGIMNMLELEASGLADIPKPNIGFQVAHGGCLDEDRMMGYEMTASWDMEDHAAWILHLEEKVWMGRPDLMRLLEFWWSHKGADVPNPI